MMLYTTTAQTDRGMAANPCQVQLFDVFLLFPRSSHITHEIKCDTGNSVTWSNLLEMKVWREGERETEIGCHDANELLMPSNSL